MRSDWLVFAYSSSGPNDVRQGIRFVVHIETDVLLHRQQGILPALRSPVVAAKLSRISDGTEIYRNNPVLCDVLHRQAQTGSAHDSTTDEAN